MKGLQPKDPCLPEVASLASIQTIEVTGEECDPQNDPGLGEKSSDLARDHVLPACPWLSSCQATRLQGYMQPLCSWEGAGMGTLFLFISCEAIRRNATRHDNHDANKVHFLFEISFYSLLSMLRPRANAETRSHVRLCGKLLKVELGNSRCWCWSNHLSVSSLTNARILEGMLARQLCL